MGNRVTRKKECMDTVIQEAFSEVFTLEECLIKVKKMEQVMSTFEGVIRDMKEVK